MYQKKAAFAVQRLSQSGSRNPGEREMVLRARQIPGRFSLFTSPSSCASTESESDSAPGRLGLTFHACACALLLSTLPSPSYSTVLLVPAAAVPSTRRASAYQSLPPCGVTRPCESENSINFATAVEPVDSARFLFACRSRIVTIRRVKMKTGRAFHFISW